jgi:hypothetical protein
MGAGKDGAFDGQHNVHWQPAEISRMHTTMDDVALRRLSGAADNLQYIPSKNTHYNLV